MPLILLCCVKKKKKKKKVVSGCRVCLGFHCASSHTTGNINNCVQIKYGDKRPERRGEKETRRRDKEGDSTGETDREKLTLTP